MNKTTIIMPVHNSGENLKPAVESILRSTAYFDSFLLIDDGSTDGSEKLVDFFANNYKNVHALHLPVREKPKEYDGRLIKVINVGIKFAKDSDIYITHDDVIHFKLYKADWLFGMKELAENEDCGLVTSINGGGVSDQTYLNNFNWIGTWSMYIPKRTIKKIGLFDENFIVGDDIDYTYRVVKEGLKCYLCDFWVDHHRQTNHQYSDKKSKMEKCVAYGKLADKSGKYFKEKHDK